MRADLAHSAVFNAACTGTTGDAASLVAAIASANGAAGDDTVRLQPGCTYTLTGPDNYWYGPNGLPAISSTMTVEGNGATIARPPGVAFRFFFVGADVLDPDTNNYVSPALNTPGGGRLTLREVTLEGGFALGGASTRGGGGAGMGGAIFSQGDVVIERSTLTGNNATGGRSGCPPPPFFCLVLGDGGGGMRTSASGERGGGFGPVPPGTFGGGVGGADLSGQGGGGAGFRYGENGAPANSARTGGGGGGPRTGTGGAPGVGNAPGNGSGAGGTVGGGSGEPGGGFGFGGGGNGSGGSGSGGGVGGGGGGGSNAAGGGFGGGGGGGGQEGGSGGFGGGGGSGIDKNGNVTGRPGFGGGTPIFTDNPPAVHGGAGAGMGGAIFNMQGEVTIRNSTLAGNSAVGGQDNVPDSGKGIGGAVFNMSGDFTAVGSTFANNTAAFDGASIFNLVYDGATARTAQTTLRNTIVTGGTGPVDLASSKTTFITPQPNLGSANAAVGEANLIRTMAVRDGGTITGTPLTSDPLLGPLEDNGGPTRTMAPAADSPVIDAGSAFGLLTDQRGLPRPADLDAFANAGDGSDIGAVERQRPVVVTGGQPPPPPPPAPAGSRAFGASTLVTLRLGQTRIGPRGLIGVVIANANGFPIGGRLSGRTANPVAAQRKRRRIALRPKTFSVPAAARRTVRLKLPKRLRGVLRRRGRLVLRMRAEVTDPAGNTRVVTRRIAPRLSRRGAPRGRSRGASSRAPRTAR